MTLRVAAGILAACLPSLVRCTDGGFMRGDDLALGYTEQEYAAALAQLDIDAVRADLNELFTTSKDFWPADFGHYGPLFVRLAWHCAGSYRSSDGRGGCGGGRQRFDPERSWADNTNLDKARALLLPIKLKYGLGLSWGDLIILAGNTAIQAMGGPVLGFCAGRVDAQDGSESAQLGPSSIQEHIAPCPVNGTCKKPLGSTTVGLIYLNPEGPMGQPIPNETALTIRDSFGRMNMNDTETVALIGGGHAFGKTHGACPNGPGPSPAEDPINPWPGKCGTGKGKDAFTSGFEFKWTPQPTKWDNVYFKELVENVWEKHVGPGGHWQWRIQNATGEKAEVGMLTSDVSLMHDPAGSYQEIVKEFANDAAAFDRAFAHAWYKLTTRDVGPVTRCAGADVPPAQPFQYPLPDPVEVLADFDEVKGDLLMLLTTSNPAFPADVYNGKSDYGPLFIRLAWQCASTYRATDFLGGCNGARIRFAPQNTWAENSGLDKALMLLQPIKEKFGEGLSWADLIVLAGNIAIEAAGGREMFFCPGRTDAVDGEGSSLLSSRFSGSQTDMVFLKDTIQVMGLSKREFVVLLGGGHSLGQKHASRSGWSGAWTENPSRLANDYFQVLLTEEWEKMQESGGLTQYKARGKPLYMLDSDIALKADDELSVIVQEYATDNELFLEDFAKAWTKLMNADRFDGPVDNLCKMPEERAAPRGRVIVV